MKNKLDLKLNEKQINLNKGINKRKARENYVNFKLNIILFAFVIIAFLNPLDANAAENVTITFKANGGSGTMSSQIVVKNENTLLKENTFTAPTTTKGFWMWNTASDGSGTYYTDEDNINFSANTTLYAQWKVINETVLTTSGGTITSGYYKLTQNLAITSGITVAAEENVVIDLNGYVLTLGTDVSATIIRNRGTLTLKDSRPNVKHYGKVDSNNIWVWDKNKEGNTSTPSGYVCITGGLITGANPSSGDGAAIYNNRKCKN